MREGVIIEPKETTAWSKALCLAFEQCECGNAIWLYLRNWDAKFQVAVIAAKIASI